jgi:hypothetical protein
MPSVVPVESLAARAAARACISNLGSTFGTAIAGTILVSVVATGNRAYAVAMVFLACTDLIGAVVAWFLPSRIEPQSG